MSAANEVVQASGERTIEVRNPANGTLIDTVPRAGVSDVAKVIEAGIEGRAEMRDMPAHRRSEILRKASERIASRHEELSRLLCLENGKTIRQCRAEMVATQRLFLDFSEEAKRLHGESIPMDAVAGLEHLPEGERVGERQRRHEKQTVKQCNRVQQAEACLRGKHPKQNCPRPVQHRQHALGGKQPVRNQANEKGRNQRPHCRCPRRQTDLLT